MKGGGSKSDNSFKLGTFIMFFMHLLMEMHYFYINKKSRTPRVINKYRAVC